LIVYIHSFDKDLLQLGVLSTCLTAAVPAFVCLHEGPWAMDIAALFSDTTQVTITYIRL